MRVSVLKVLVIGCGSMGSVIAKAAENMKAIEEILLYDQYADRAEQLARAVERATALSELKLENANLLIEAASQQAAKEIVPLALESGLDTILMSVGAFVDEAFQRRCFEAVSSRHARIVIPSGAVAGVGALRGAGIAKLEIVRLTSTKPPKGFSGVRYLEEEGIVPEELKERTVLYSGPASRAVQLFPANVNVAATVSLVGVGFERTEVEVVCDPSARVNSHHLFARGEFGELEATTRNLPSPDNPRTSYLASLSAVSALKSYTSGVWIGV